MAKSKKIIIMFIVLICAALLFFTFFNKRISYKMSLCAYCGAGRTIEGRIIGTTIKRNPPVFPSENPPEHEHLFIPCASHSSGAYFDFITDDLDMMWQLKKLNDKNPLSDKMIEEWFSIDIKNQKMLDNFINKYELEIKDPWQE